MHNDAIMSKYDVMISEETMISMNVFKLAGRIYKLSQEFARGLMSQTEFDRHYSDLVFETLLQSKVIGHLIYENGKDLFNVDSKYRDNYIRNNNLDFKTFPQKYSNIFDRYAKMLVLFMIIEEEKIDISNITNVAACEQISKGNSLGVFTILEKPVTALNPDNFALMHKMLDDNFSVGDLDQKQIDRLNNFHEAFMKEKIYPRVTIDIRENYRIMNQAKKIGQKKISN